VTGEFNRWQAPPVSVQVRPQYGDCARGIGGGLLICTSDLSNRTAAPPCGAGIHGEIGATAARHAVPRYVRWDADWEYAGRPSGSVGKQSMRDSGEAMLVERQTGEEVLRQFEKRGLSPWSCLGDGSGRKRLLGKFTCKRNQEDASPGASCRGPGSPPPQWIETAGGGRDWGSAFGPGLLSVVGRPCNWTADRVTGNRASHGALGRDWYSGTSRQSAFVVSWRLAGATGGTPIFRRTGPERALAKRCRETCR